MLIKYLFTRFSDNIKSLIETQQRQVQFMGIIRLGNSFSILIFLLVKTCSFKKKISNLGKMFTLCAKLVLHWKCIDCVGKHIAPWPNKGNSFLILDIFIDGCTQWKNLHHSWQKFLHFFNHLQFKQVTQTLFSYIYDLCSISLNTTIKANFCLVMYDPETQFSLSHKFNTHRNFDVRGPINIWVHTVLLNLKIKSKT